MPKAGKIHFCCIGLNHFALPSVPCLPEHVCVCGLCVCVCVDCMRALYCLQLGGCPLKGAFQGLKGTDADPFVKISFLNGERLFFFLKTFFRKE